MKLLTYAEKSFFIRCFVAKSFNCSLFYNKIIGDWKSENTNSEIHSQDVLRTDKEGNAFNNFFLE